MSRKSRLLLSFIASALALAHPAHARAPSASNTIHDKYVETAPGVKIHVLEAGIETDKPALVLIPGWRLTASLWQQQIQVFSRDRKVIAVDSRSQGASTITPEGNTPEERARDLKAVTEALAPGPKVLVGWSQGVQDVAAFVGQFGVSGLSGIVLVDSTVSSGSSALSRAPEAATQQLRQVATYVRNPRAWTEGMIRAIIRRSLSGPEFQNLVDEALKTPTAIGASMLVDDLLGPDRTPALASMKVPTLVIASSSSQELAAQQAMANRLPQGRFEVMKEAGHALFIDQPQRFEAILTSFLASLDPVSR